MPSKKRSVAWFTVRDHLADVIEKRWTTATPGNDAIRRNLRSYLNPDDFHSLALDAAEAVLDETDRNAQLKRKR